MPHLAGAQEVVEEYSFEDAQRDPSLLNSQDEELNDALASKASIHQEQSQETPFRLQFAPSIQMRIDAEPSSALEGNQIIIIDGKVQEDLAVQEAEEVRIQQEIEREIQKEALREEKRREKEAFNLPIKLAKEAEEKKLAIEVAIENKKVIERQANRLDRESKTCTKWNAGRSGVEAIGRQLIGLWQSSRPSMRELAQREALIRDASIAIERRWPNCGLQLVPFGSSRTGLLEALSDVDLTLVDPMRPYGVGTPKKLLLPPPEGARFSLEVDSYVSYGIERLPDYYSVNLIASALRRFGNDNFIKVNPIRHAKVPIVEVTHRPSGISSDINVNDGFGTINSDMLEAYCDCDEEIVRPFLFAVKKWTSRRGINDPAGKSGMCSWNSYTTCLIAIQFLQIKKVVPNLQDPALLSDRMRTFVWQKPTKSFPGHGIKKSSLTVEGCQMDPETGAREFDVTFAMPQDIFSSGIVHQNGSHNNHIMEKKVKPSKLNTLEIHCKIGLLFKEFFIWLSEFDFDECGISIRLGQPFRKKLNPTSKKLLELPYLKRPSLQWNNGEPILIQDPFILDRNTSGAVKREMRDIINEECWRARELLEEKRPDESTLLSDLLVDYSHEELVHKHEEEMRPFDTPTRELIESKSKQKTSKHHR